MFYVSWPVIFFHVIAVFDLELLRKKSIREVTNYASYQKLKLAKKYRKLFKYVQVLGIKCFYFRLYNQI